LKSIFLNFVRLRTSNLQQIESDKTFAVSESKTAIVAAWVRHAAIEALKRELSPELLATVAGHGANRPRVSYLPLPTIGGYGHTLIRRVSISAPAELTNVIQLMRRVLPGRILIDNDGNQVCTLVEARSSSVFEHYHNSGTEFETTTPAIFPHHLTKNGRLDQRRIQRAAKWFAEAGLPEPAGLSVDIQREKFFVPAYLQHLPQYRVQVRFGAEIAGPVTVGLGRFFGLGIFANRAGIRTTGRVAENDGSLEHRSTEESVGSQAVALAV
jgi:CRISPR-associated protein Csb2